MKKVIAILLTITVIITIAACGKNKPGVTGTGMTLEEELEAVKAMQNALREFSEPGGSNSSDNSRIIKQEPHQGSSRKTEELVIYGEATTINKEAGLMLEYDFSKTNSYNTAYSELPYYVFLQKQRGENEFTGNRYCTPGIVDSIWCSEDLDGVADIIEISVVYYGYDFENDEMLWENNKYERIAIVQNDEQEDWGNIKPGDLILLYFTYIGYSDVIDMQYGFYEHSEPLQTY